MYKKAQSFTDISLAMYTAGALLAGTVHATAGGLFLPLLIGMEHVLDTRAWHHPQEVTAHLQGMASLPAENKDRSAVVSFAVRAGLFPCPSGIKQWHKSVPKQQRTETRTRRTTKG